LRENRRALHVEDDVIAGDVIADAIENRVAHGLILGAGTYIAETVIACPLHGDCQQKSQS
jgi:hypothetical protein